MNIIKLTDVFYKFAQSAEQYNSQTFNQVRPILNDILDKWASPEYLEPAVVGPLAKTPVGAELRQYSSIWIYLTLYLYVDENKLPNNNALSYKLFVTGGEGAKGEDPNTSPLSAPTVKAIQDALRTYENDLSIVASSMMVMDYFVPSQQKGTKLITSNAHSVAVKVPQSNLPVA